MITASRGVAFSSRHHVRMASALRLLRSVETTPVISSRAFGGRARSVTRVVGGGSPGGGRHEHGQRQQKEGGGRRGSWAEEGVSFVRYATWLVCTYHCLREYVAEPCLVRGPSMRPTIEHGSWLLVDKVRYTEGMPPNYH